MKKFSLGLIIAGAILTAATLFLPLLSLTAADTPETGIINGSGTPTYLYIFCENMYFNCALLSAGIIFVLCGIFCLLFPRTVSQCCGVKTTLTAVAVPAFSVSGIVFFVLANLSLWLGEQTKREMQTIWLGITVFVVSFICLLIYVILRVKKPSFKGTAIDILLALITVPFWYFFSNMLLFVII